MKRFYSTFAALALAAISVQQVSAQAQRGVCGTDEQHEYFMSQHPEIARQRAETEARIIDYVANMDVKPIKEGRRTVRVIPVVIHIITEDGTGGITKQQAIDGVRVLNEDYRKLNADTTQIRPVFKSYAADCEVEFRMARRDPNGQPTEGIVRAASPLTNSANPRDQVKAVSRWPTNKYLNIWLVKSIYSANAQPGTYVAGYAEFPTNNVSNTYGFVCRLDSWSVNDRTATHEIGHCLNLYHTFQGACGTTCANSGDYVCDTPPSLEPRFDCNPNQNTCSNDVPDMLDNNENYMSYNNCKMMFTYGQKDRMDASFANYAPLQTLTSGANATQTGTDGSPQPATKPIALFIANKTVVCQGGTVNFTDHSYNADVDNTWTWNWQFPGADVATSSVRNPSVVYSTPGRYAVTLMVSNSVGGDTMTRTGYIVVKSTTGETAPYSQGIEDPNFPANSNANLSWEVVSNSTVTWERYTAASTEGNASIRVNNSAISDGKINSLISPSINLTGIQNPTLTFDVAYAKKSSTSADILRVAFSTNCGESWTVRYAKSGASLSTIQGGGTTTNFVPTANDWRTESINIGSPFANSANLRIKFEAESNAGNPIYIDRINLTGLSATDQQLVANSINLYPNPASKEVKLQLNLAHTSVITYQIMDIVGKEIYAAKSTQMPAGAQEITLPLHNVRAGVYFVKVTEGNNITTKKLIVE